MPLREITPCDFEGICPYGAESWGHCEWFCGEPDEPNYDEYDESEDETNGYSQYQKENS